MNKVNFFALLFFSSKRVFKSIQPKIKNLEKEMREIDAMENKVEAIVRLFQIISPLQDSGGLSQELSDLRKCNRNGKFKRQIEALEILQAHFHSAGRSEYGINRTARGEKVTADKIFLGNVFGLWTEKASYWLSKKTELENTLRPDVSLEKPVSNWYIINDYQCGGFIKSHASGIIEQIAVLKAAA